jgi:hypothetical protein
MLAENFADCPSGGQTQRSGNQGEKHALAYDEALDCADRSSQRRADADLAPAPANRVAHHAIESNRLQQQPDGAEDGEKSSGQPGKEERGSEVFV